MVAGSSLLMFSRNMHCFLSIFSLVVVSDDTVLQTIPGLSQLSYPNWIIFICEGPHKDPIKRNESVVGLIAYLDTIGTVAVCEWKQVSNRYCCIRKHKNIGLLSQFAQICF